MKTIMLNIIMFATIASTAMGGVNPHSGGYAPVIKKVTPSVVTVSTTKHVKSPLQTFFPGFAFPQAPQFQQQTQNSLGSGVIIDSGYVLTNHHVIDGADEVLVSTQDQKGVKAEVVGFDEKTDLAVLKVNAKDMRPIALGNSDEIEVGDIVLAVGNPFGIGITVTSGIISAKERGGLGIEDYEDFLQTDAAINPGNSGGALVDEEGRLVGINTAILSRSGSFAGVGFAIPVNLAKAIYTQLKDNGRVSHAYLGVSLQDITPELQKAFKTDGGVLVSSVAADTPAAKAGLQEGDVILKANDRPMDSSNRLRTYIGTLQPNTMVQLEVIRNGETRKLSVKLGTLADARTVSGANSVLSGVRFETLGDKLYSQYHIPSDLHGCVITDVDNSSVAATVGLRPGMVIVEVNRQRVKSVEDLVEIMDKDPNSGAALLRVWADGLFHYVVLQK